MEQDKSGGGGWDDAEFAGDHDMIPEDPAVLRRQEIKRASRMAAEDKERQERERQRAKREAEIERIKAGRCTDSDAQSAPVEHAQNQVDKVIAVTLPTMPMAQLFYPGCGLCELCERQKFGCSDDACLNNSHLLAWARHEAPEVVPIFCDRDIATLKRAADHRNVASVLLYQEKYEHLRALIKEIPALLTQDLMFVVAAKADHLALEVVRELFIKRSNLRAFANGPTFYEWAFEACVRPVFFTQTKYKRRIARPTPPRKISLLHVCIATHQFELLGTLALRLRSEVGFERYCEIMRELQWLPLAHYDAAEHLSPLQFAVRYHVAELLELIASITDTQSGPLNAVALAAQQMDTIPSLKLLVKFGARLEPIWSAIRDDPKLRWLFCLIFDAFFEQGLRCRGPRCFVHKIASPNIQAIIVSFIWPRLRRPTAAKMAAIGDRRGMAIKDS